MSALVEAGLAAKTGLATLAVMAVQGTLLALVALVLVRAGRLRPAWQAAVWLVVLAKFVLPWGPALPWSLADLVAMLRGGGEVAAAPFVLTPAAAPAARAAPAAPSIGWLVLAAVWLAGVCGRAAPARSPRTAARSPRRARAPAAPAEARALLARLAAGVRVRAPRLVVGDAATGPHVVGLASPDHRGPAGAARRAGAAPRGAAARARARPPPRRARPVRPGAGAAPLFWFFPVVRLVEPAARARARGGVRCVGARGRRDAAPGVRAPAGADGAAAHRGGAGARRTAHARRARRRPCSVRRRARASAGCTGSRSSAWIALALGGARTAARARRAPACASTRPSSPRRCARRTPRRTLDGDGVLSRDEACEFQAERAPPRLGGRRWSPRLDDDARPSCWSEPLCCNCDAVRDLLRGLDRNAGASCHRVDEGVIDEEAGPTVAWSSGAACQPDTRNLERKIDELSKKLDSASRQGGGAGRGGAAAAPAAAGAGSREDLRGADRRRSVRRSGRREGHDRQGVRLRLPVLREGPRDDGRAAQEVRQRSARRLQAARRPPAERDGRRARVLRRGQAGQAHGDGRADLGQGLQGPPVRHVRRARRGRERSAAPGRAERKCWDTADGCPNVVRLRAGAPASTSTSSRPT